MSLYRSSRKEPCPICKKDTSKLHCQSPYCKWLICFKCSNRSVVVFKKNQKFFISEEY